MRKHPSSRGETTHTIITLVLLAIPIALLLAPLVFGYLLLPTDLYDSLTLPFSHAHPVARASNAVVPDAILQFYPYKLYARDAWLSGRFGFWNPYILCGYPQYAETMATNFDVLNVLLLVFPFPVAFFVFTLAPLLLAGLGMWLLCREYGLRIWIARLCAFAYMLNSSFICYLYPHFIPGSFCWVPFLILFTKRYLDGWRTSDLALASIFCALSWLGGTVQTAAFVAVVEALFVLSYGTPTQGLGITVWRRVRSGLFIAALGVLISLVMWAPTLELFLNVVKDGLLASTSLSRSYTLVQRLLTLPMLLTFLWPTLATVANGFSIYSVIGAYPIDFNAAIGFFPLMIAVWAAVVFRHDPRFRPFLLLAITSLVLPIATPLYHLLYHRFFVVLVFGAVMLCGLALESVLSSEPAREKFKRFAKVSLRLFVALSLLLVIVATIVTINYTSIERYASVHFVKYSGVAFADGNSAWMHDRLQNFLTSFSLTSWTLWSSIAAIAIAAIGLRRLLHSESSALKLMTLGTTLQLLVFAFSWSPMVKSSEYPIFPSSSVTTSLSHSPERIYVDRHLYRGHQYIFLNNTNVMYGIADVAGYESLLPRSFYVAFTRQPSDTIPPLSLLRSLNVGHVVTGDWITLPDSIPFSTSEGLHVYDISRGAARVWLSSHARVVDDSAVIGSLLRSGLNRDTVYLAESESSTIDGTDAVGSATITKAEPEHIEISAEASSDCFLVLSDTFYPGWEATVDGLPTEVFRANYAMRAIRIKAGSHRVTFTFRPLALRLGAYGSVAGLLIALSLLFVGRRGAPHSKRET